MPTDPSAVAQQVLGLIARAFNSLGHALESIFTIFLKVSPLRDDADFFLFFIIIIALVFIVIRMFRGRE